MKRILFVILALLVIGSSAAWSRKSPSHRIVMQLASADTVECNSPIKHLKNLKKGWVTKR